ncbi:MAG: hypothetical protein NTX04_04670 [Verrucomicrobia bacterium]|nr:hypothetical protein [Verrucomicrobiota bacterium]
MFTPHEIFARMPINVAEQFCTFLMEKEPALYQTTIDTLAQQRKLRTIYVTRKPRAERHAWMCEVLGRKTNDGVAAHLLQVWFVGDQAPLLCDFLGALGIPHDANGTVEALPPAPPSDTLLAAIETVLTKHPLPLVTVYLHSFQALDDQGWASLEELLQTDSRFKL